MWDTVDVDLLVLQPAVFVLQVTQVHLCNRGDESTGSALHLFTFRQNWGTALKQGHSSTDKIISADARFVYRTGKRLFR